MRNKELKKEIETLKHEEVSWIFLLDQLKRVETLERWLATNDIEAIFSELICKYILPESDKIICITNKPIEASYIRVLYDYDGYRIEYRNASKLHLIGLSKRQFKRLKDKFEAKYI